MAPSREWGSGRTGGRRRRVALTSLTALILGVILAAVALAAGPSGSATQVAGKSGCYTSDGSSGAGPGTCRKIRGGESATTVVISRDGRFAYLTGYGENSRPPVLSIFRRNPRTGTLHQIPGKSGCWSIDGSSEDGAKTCRNGRDIDTGDATSLTISRDGRFLYLASQLSVNNNDLGGIAIFARNARKGTLRQLKGKQGCISATGASEDGPGTCRRAREIDDEPAVHLTPDQKYLYASNYDSNPHGGIAIFARSRRTGKLHQLRGKNGCLTADGTTEQSGTNKVCRTAENLGEVWDVATPDNRFAYVPASYGPDLLQAFRRNSKGGLVPLAGKTGCVSDDGISPAGPCVDGRGMFKLERAVLSKNKRFIYTYGYTDPGVVAVINRNLHTGRLSQRSGKAGCISSDGSSGDGAGTCQEGRAIADGYAGALAPSGRTLYYTSYGPDALIIFRVSPRTGAIHQLAGKDGCVSLDGSSEDGAGTCRVGKALDGPYQVALAAKGRDVYVAADNSNGVDLLRAKR